MSENLINTSPASRGASMPQTPQAPIALSNVKVQSANLSASKVASRDLVTVTARVANTGVANGIARITVYVNGQEDASQVVTLGSGTAEEINFTSNRPDPGTYSVFVGGVQAGSFVVDDLAGPNVVLFGSLAVIGLALIIAVIYLIRRRQVAH